MIVTSATQTEYTQTTSKTTATNATSACESTTTTQAVSQPDTTSSASTAQTTLATISTKWGFKVDENGFFGTDFNKAAGIPENVKIHQTMMDIAEKYTAARGDGMDSLKVFSRVWTLYSTIAGDTLDPSGTGYMTQQEAAAMPKSYVSKGSLTDGIVSVQKNMDQWNAMSKIAADVDNATDGLLNTGWKGFMAFDGVSGRDNNGETAFYGSREVFELHAGTKYEEKESDDKLAVGELFGAFFYKRVDEETNSYNMDNNNTSMSGVQYNGSVKATKEYYKFLESGQDIKTYISNTKGKDYLEEFSNRISRLPNGEIDTDLADKFFEELDKSLQNERAQYQANSYPSLDASTSKTAADLTDNGSLGQLSQMYQTTQKIKLPTAGSLINIGA